MPHVSLSLKEDDDYEHYQLASHFGSSWVEAVEAFTDMTKLVEAIGLESVL